MLTIWKKITIDGFGSAYWLNDQIEFCCNHTLELQQLLWMISWKDDYKGLLELNHDLFQKWQNQLISRSFYALKNNNHWTVTCQWCREKISCYTEAYSRWGQFFHRGECSSKSYLDEQERSMDYYERMYYKRLAMWINCDQDFIEDSEIEENNLYILYKWWYTRIIIDKDEKFNIWIDGWAFIECDTYGEINIFFRSVRYLMEDWMPIEDIINFLQTYFWESFFWINELPLDWIWWMIDEIFKDDQYNFANHSYRNDINDYDLSDERKNTLARLIWILRLADRNVVATIVAWLKILKNT